MSKSTEQPTARQIIRRRRYQLRVRNGYVSLCCRAVLVVILGVLFCTQFLLLTQAPDQSMYPTIQAGDLIVAYRLQSTFSKNDVIVYEADGALHIGRVVARETDTVMMDDSGYLLVNGTTQTGEILFSTYARGEISYPYTVPAGYVYVLCDYRTDGTDSRDYGAIALSDIRGKVITTLRRRSI